MNRLIKFRGCDVETGEFVYGDFITRGPLESKPGIIDDEDFYHEVDPESVAQLVEYDADGGEVYEGDVFYYNEQGRPVSAELAVILVDNLGHSYYFPKNVLHSVF